MREEIQDSISRMTKDDCLDVQRAFNLKECSKAYIRKMAFADEDIAEYILIY